MARITIYFGHYGSGKTELSLTKAYSMAKDGQKVMLVDLDIVNPYFRSGDKIKELNEQGIRVIRPNFEGKNVDVPSIPGEVSAAFADKESNVIFDIGGSPSGASAIGRYSKIMQEEDYESILVVNALRPFTTTAEDIVAMAEEISGKSRIPIQKLVNNTNVAYDTTAKMVEDTQPIIEEAANRLNIKVSNIYALKSTADNFSESFKQKYKDKIIIFELNMRPAWLDSTK